MSLLILLLTDTHLILLLLGYCLLPKNGIWGPQLHESNYILTMLAEIDQRLCFSLEEPSINVEESPGLVIVEICLDAVYQYFTGQREGFGLLIEQAALIFWHSHHFYSIWSRFDEGSFLRQMLLCLSLCSQRQKWAIHQQQHGKQVLLLYTLVVEMDGQQSTLSQSVILIERVACIHRSIRLQSQLHQIIQDTQSTISFVFICFLYLLLVIQRELFAISSISQLRQIVSSAEGNFASQPTVQDSQHADI